ncbi:hypothetical protein GCM10027514_15400 [Azotobacter armeniacus]
METEGRGIVVIPLKPISFLTERRVGRQLDCCRLYGWLETDDQTCLNRTRGPLPVALQAIEGRYADRLGGLGEGEMLLPTGFEQRVGAAQGGYAVGGEQRFGGWK